MNIEEKVKMNLLTRGFDNKTQLNNRGLIGATIDETILEVVKNLRIADVSKSFASGKKVVITGKKARHEFEIGEIVTLVLKEPSGLWKAYSEQRGNWWIDESDANVC